MATFDDIPTELQKVILDKKQELDERKRIKDLHFRIREYAIEFISNYGGHLLDEFLEHLLNDEEDEKDQATIKEWFCVESDED